MPYFRTLMLALLLVAACQTPPVAPPAAAATDEPAATPPVAVLPAPPPLTVPPVAEAPEPALDDDNAIYFATGSTRVDAAGERKLLIHAARLVEDRKAIVTLTGLTDSRGSRSYNLLLAEQRIDAVAKILRAQGVQKNQIRPYALGNKTPERDCKSAACREKMRRVELGYDAP